MSKTYDKGMIRPVGIVAFLAVACILLACFYWLAPFLIKESVERVGSQLNGAKVELSDVDISLSPAGLYFYDLQVADAKSPMQNIFEFEQAYAELDLFELWSGKVIVDDLNVSTLQFGTARKYSGAIERKQSSDDTQDVVTKEKVTQTVSDQFERFGGELPSAETVLERHPLQTTKLASELDSTFSAQKSQWENLSAKLPDDERLAYYERELKALTEGDIKSLEDFNQRKQKFDALREEIKQDEAQLRKAKKQVTESKELVQNAYTELKNAPAADWDSIRKKYGLNAEGGLNLTGLLFGDEFQAYAESALYWYRRLAPLMAQGADSAMSEETVVKPPRGEGRFVHFGNQKTSPDFMVRNAEADAVLSQGRVAIQGKDITHQQYLSGRPSIITANASELNDTEAFDVRVSIDHRTDASVNDFSANIKGQQLDNLSLSESDSMPLSIAEAKLDLNTKIQLRGESLSGDLRSRFNNASFVSGGESTIARELGNALKQVNTFALEADLGGELSSPDFSISSDLDRVLKNAVAGRLQEKQKEWEAKIKAGLNDKLNSYLAENDGLAEYFSDQGSVVEADLSKIDQLLEQKLGSFADSKKQEAKEKVQEKLKGLF